jgi:hypothetical protein
MINIMLTVGGFVLLKGVFLMLFTRDNHQTDPMPQLDAGSPSHIGRHKINGADPKELAEADVAA